MNEVNYNLERFIEAQHTGYTIALSEIKHGRKQSHWMWYIFPQVQGLGLTATSKYYAIKNIDEATAYLSNEILGRRLMEISNALLEIKTNNAGIVFGNPDDMKLRSSMTLFAEVQNTNKVFQQVLDKFFNGKKDEKTLQFLKA